MDLLDPYSQLPNRTALRSHVQQALQQIETSRGRGLALILIALDSLSQINKLCGLATADAYLFAWAQRLRRLIGSGGECYFVHGSHFALVLPQVSDRDQIHQQLLGWLRELTQPFDLAEKRLEVQVTMGVACAPRDGLDFDDLITNATAARDEARALGGERIAHFSAERRLVGESQLALISDLSAAVDEGAFELHYQPTIDTRSGEICALEALIRWRHPQRGLISPQHFIGAAEETGLIHAIGRWTLRQLLIEFGDWQAAGRAAPQFSFNVSPRELAEYGFVEALDQILAAHSGPVPPLEVEITENLMVHYPERSARVLRRLCSRGFRIAIDDFGSGHASLLYLQRFPVDKIKIDRQYVEGLLESTRQRALVSAMTKMARELGAELVAEGVETVEQLRSLQAMGCYRVQGYLYCRPLPMSELLQWQPQELVSA